MIRWVFNFFSSYVMLLVFFLSFWSLLLMLCFWSFFLSFFSVLYSSSKNLSFFALIQTKNFKKLGSENCFENTSPKKLKVEVVLATGTRSSTHNWNPNQLPFNFQLVFKLIKRGNANLKLNFLFSFVFFWKGFQSNCWLRRIKNWDRWFRWRWAD